MPANSSAMTPSRVTKVYFDEPFYDLSQGLWGAWRFYDQISPGAAANKAADGRLSSQMYYWSSGAWTLRPLQFELGKFCETDPGVAGTLGESDTTTVVGKWNPGTSSGLTDLFFRKDSADATTAPASLSPPAKITALPTALESSMAVAMDPILKTDASLGINQALCLRFVVDGVNRNGYTWIGAVAFGQYSIALRGDGWAELWEYGTPSGGSAQWIKHDTFRFSKPNQVTNNYHQIIIFPHVGPTGEKFLAFASANLDSPGQGAAGLASTPGVRSTAGSLVSSEYLFRWDEISAGLPDSSGGAGNVTTSEKLWILERRNIRGQWQVSRLVFADAGTLLSDFWGSELGDSRAATLNKIAVLPASTALTSTLKDGTGSTVSLSSAGNAFYVQWDFSGPKTTTPILWAYKIQREAQTTLRTPTAFNLKGTDWHINPSTDDPRQASASFRVEDKTGDYPRLASRGEIPCRVVVTDSSSGTPVDITLHKGVAISPMRTNLGRSGKLPGASGMYSGGSNYFASWSQYQVTAAGMWHRLQVTTLRTALSYQDFAYDAGVGLSGTGQIQGWKVTDAIKRLLTVAGFPSGMQRIPDLAIRFAAGIGTQDSDRILEPSTSIAEMLVRLCRNYLGRFLVFDANSGDYGQWTLVGPPSDTTPLAAFVGSVTWANGDAILPVGSLASYPAGTAPTFGHRESFTIPPENNHLVALTVVDSQGTGGYRVDNHVYNYLSYAVPGATVSPDPDSPHYLGYERAVILADPAMWAGAAVGGWEATQKAIDYVLFRVFAYTCMARQVVKFTAPLLFVTDPTTSNKRPLQFYDVVTLDGTAGWYVRSCTPEYNSDRNQVAEYVLEKLVEYRP